MRIVGHYGDNLGERIVEIERRPSGVWIHIHPPESTNGQRIHLDFGTVQTGLAELRTQRFVTLEGQMRGREKRIDIEDRGPDIELWIRTVRPDGETGGWA